MTEAASSSPRWSALAVGAHPDDIEFMMAGTLLLLQQAGAAIHLWNLCNGSGGTAVHTREEIIRIRGEEAKTAARVAGGTVYAPIADDLELLYEPAQLARVGAVIRRVQPRIILLPSLPDYMEDHQNAARLVVTAAFSRAMSTVVTDPPVTPWDGETTLYHALPYGLHDGMRRLVRPELYVDVSAVLATKREMLAQHRSQKEWLDVSQGVDAYLTMMEAMCREVGRMSGGFAVAEGWRRHAHLGFSAADTDPLAEILGDACRIDQAYVGELG